MNQIEIGSFIARKRKEKNFTQACFQRNLEYQIKPYQNGKQEFQIVNDITHSPRLHKHA